MGVVLACPPCFLGFGVLLVSRFFLPSCGLVVGGWGSGCWGFSRVRGWVRPVLAPCGGGGRVRLARPALLLSFLLGWVGCVCAWFLTSLCFGGWGLGVFVRLVHSWDAVSGGGSGGPALFWGLGVPGFLFVFAVVFGRVRGGVSGCFCFRSALPSSGLGGVGLGWGCFFSGCSARSGLGSGSGLVLFGEFDPGSGRTLAACLTHASRTGPSSFFGGRVEWRTGEYHVSNLPSSPG